MRKLLSQKEAAEWIGVHVGTLRRWRRERSGPAFIALKDGHREIIRYREEDLDEWAEALKKQPSGAEH